MYDTSYCMYVARMYLAKGSYNGKRLELHYSHGQQIDFDSSEYCDVMSTTKRQGCAMTVVATLLCVWVFTSLVSEKTNFHPHRPDHLVTMTTDRGFKYLPTLQRNALNAVSNTK